MLDAKWNKDDFDKALKEVSDLLGVKFYSNEAWGITVDPKPTRWQRLRRRLWFLFKRERIRRYNEQLIAGTRRISGPRPDSGTA